MCSESACLETTPEHIFVDEADTNPVLIIDKLQKKVLTPHFHSKESMIKFLEKTIKWAKVSFDKQDQEEQQDYGLIIKHLIQKATEYVSEG